MTIPDGALTPCSCCHGALALLYVGPVAGFCERCRPPSAVLEDPGALYALVESVTGGNPPPCPH